MKGKQAHEIELEASMKEFLEEMVGKYHLTGVSKAVRCLVNYAREESGRQDAIFSEIRCLDC